MAALSALPNEILALVTRHLDRPEDVSHLALTSRRLNDFVQRDGWKSLARGRFRLAGVHCNARDAVHGLTTLYRNWDRKAFISRYQEPTAQVTSLQHWQQVRWKGPQGQTMGYQPSIDSYEEMTGAWTERKEVLAWSAGNQVVMRIKETGAKAATVLDYAASHSELDDFKHLNKWFSYTIPRSLEGVDDIKALRVLRPHQKHHGSENIAFGTASGYLSLLDVNPERQQTKTKIYDTKKQPVGSLSVSPTKNPLIATTLGYTSLALYPVHQDQEDQQAQIRPLDRIDLVAPGASDGRLWTCNFLSDDKIAVGIGPTSKPIQVHEVTPTGFVSEPLRKLNWSDGRINGEARRNTSVYPIVPIPSSNVDPTGARGGNIFLSGGYDGLIRLHDLRSPRDFDALYWDPTNDSSIYSLALQGLERIIAGSSMHSMLKVFDLRYSGSHTYNTIPLSSPTTPPAKRRTAPQSTNEPSSDIIVAYNPIVSATSSTIPQFSGGWNLFLHPRNPSLRPRHPHNNNSSSSRHQYHRSREDSPIYTLSIPSPTSPHLYAGREAAVQSLTFTSVTDAHPDPLLAKARTHFADSGKVNLKASYNSRDDAMNLGMYEQGNEEDGVGMRLLVQEGIGAGLLRKGGRRGWEGLDVRWSDPREEGERWVRDGGGGGGSGGIGGARGRGGGRGRAGRRRGRGRRAS